jgi:MFS family permease
MSSSSHHSKGYWKRFTLALIVGVSGQFSGINAILFYAKNIFLRITDNNEARANYYCLGLGLAQTITTLLSSLFLDRLGKRTFMLIGQSIILITLFSIFLTDLINPSEPVFIVMIFIHIVGFSLSLGPIIWMYISEILKEQSLIIGVIWMLTILAAISTEMLVQNIGIGWMCLIYFCLEAMAFLYIVRYMKETQGKSHKEIEDMFEEGQLSEEDEGEHLRL